MKKILVLTLLSFLDCKNKPICTVNENNAGKGIYDLDEAICFIALKINKKKFDFNLIRDALLTEMNYMEKTELTSDNSNAESELESNTELDINQMVEYVLNEGKVELTKTQLIEIYETEVEYLKFIGVANE